jgi:hypothetical protein
MKVFPLFSVRKRKKRKEIQRKRRKKRKYLQQQRLGRKINREEKAQHT